MSARAVFCVRRHLCRHAISARSSKLEPLQQLRSAMLSPVSSGSVVFVRHQSVTPLPKLSEEPLPVPTPSGTKKDYAPKITGLVDQISGLTLIEVADLSELLKKTLNIPDQAFMGSFAAAGVAAQSAAPEEDETIKKKEKTTFTLRLTKYDETKKVPLIKEIKNIVEGLNLVQAKKYVESLPQVVRLDIAKDEAEKIKAQLEAAGGTVELD